MVDKIIIDERFLHTVSESISLQKVRDMHLWSRLKKANDTAWVEGYGLAAIQIGVPVRFAWLSVNNREDTLLNPEITFLSEPFVNREGCLSIIDTWIDMKRYNRIEYVSHGKKKKAVGIKALIIQHEVDHMNGILITDIQRDD